MKTISILIGLLLIFLNSQYLLSSELGPTEQLKPAIARLMAILEDESLQGKEPTRARRERIMAIIGDGFDFHEMSRRVLGRTWNEISVSQRDQFVIEMTKLLENVYLSKLESYTGQEVRFIAERIKGSRAQVTSLVEYQNNSIPVHYIMHKPQGKWMVYDINIEGVSLIRNFLEQFRSMMRQHKFEDLIQIIKTKNLTFAKENVIG